MADKENWEKQLSDNSLTILVAILFVAVISVVLIIGFYVVYFRGMASAATWGQVGDFFGGTLNPIFGFLSVMALLVALVIQSRELKVSSEELKNSALALNAQNKAIAHQSFEQTFFSWLDSYGDMLASVTYVYKENEYSGRNALKSYFEFHFSRKNLAAIEEKHHPGLSRSQFGELSLQDFEKRIVESPLVLTEAAIEAWSNLYKQNEYQLDSLFRNLYRLILWIDSQHPSRISLSQKWFYVSIVRAQLSWIEMAYLFYNGYTERGKKLNRLIEKYSLFNNLNFDSNRVIAHIREHGCSNIFYAETAYDSRLARIQLGLPESTEETLAMAVI